MAALLKRWGFTEYGVKIGNGKEEQVLVKRMKDFDRNISFRKNFPNIQYDCNKYILPIFPQYHTTLLPDSKLNNENKIDFLGREPHRYALQKVYISWAPENGVKSGDLILFYRTGSEGSNKKYTSVVTTVAMVDEIISNIHSQEELLSICQNRSVFSTEELKGFWRDHRRNLKVLKFIFVKSLSKRLTLGYLWDHDIVCAPRGPRSFMKLSDEQYNQIMHDSETEIKYVE